MKSWLITWGGLLFAVATILSNAAVEGPMTFGIPAGIQRLTASVGTSTVDKTAPNPNSALLAPLHKKKR